MLQIAQEIVYFAHINSNHIMKIINFAETNSILNQYVAEIRDVQVQSDRLRFRRNIERIGEIMAYEMSKDFAYSQKNIQTPLGIAPVQTPDNQLVLSTILRAGLPFHQGFLSYFDGAENAFVSAYRKYKDTLKFDIHIEYIASPQRIHAFQKEIVVYGVEYPFAYRIATAVKVTVIYSGISERDIGGRHIEITIIIRLYSNTMSPVN